MNEVSAKQRVKPSTTIKTKQQHLAKEVFSPQTTMFRRERLIPLSEFNNNYKFSLTDIDQFTKSAWAIPLKYKSGLSITNGFKSILSEG